ncbi:MAG: NADH-quinone oxidoreductase subunit K, partial [Deltaproteobacteria bacterium]|nr:NADH-quinone oxidoreductase subunit K [Deltaproteobacteria bacterium]
MIAILASHWNYLAVIILMMVGLYIMISGGNLVKKIMGMNVFQTAVILLYVSMGNVAGG